MKKLILLIFLTSLTTAFGQTLKFDLYATYSISHHNTTFESTAFAMSSNDNYIMKFIKSNGLPYQTANVYDLKSLKIYEFILTELKSEKGEIDYEFKYANTYKIGAEPTKDIHFEFQSVATENDVETVNLLFYKDKSKTKITGSSELKIIKSDVNLFPLFRFMCFHLLEFTTELNYPKAALVTQCVSKKGSSEYKLTAFGETNLEVTLPN